MEELEPNEYFKDLKTKLNALEYDELQKNRNFLEKELIKAHELGQKNLTHKSSVLWEILEKEAILLASGFNKYVYKDDIIKFIDNVNPKNSVKIVELENYPRSIPDENVQIIKKIKDLDIFDVLLIVYTDFTDQEVLTPKQKEFIERNRDPIIFGMFVENKIDFKHERLYFITDWEDEFCHLTFSKMIEEMSKLGIKEPSKTIEINQKAIKKIVDDSKLEIENVIFNKKYPKKSGFVSKLISLFKPNHE